MLFWVNRELDLWGFGHAVLHHVDLELIDGAWRGRGGGGGGTFSASEILAEMGVGLHRLGGSSSDPARLTQAIASPEVASIELRSEEGLLVTFSRGRWILSARNYLQRTDHLRPSA